MNDVDVCFVSALELRDRFVARELSLEEVAQVTEYLSWTTFTYPFNITEQPAATVPYGLSSDGLPVALQFLGRWHDDTTVLRASAAFEDAFPWTLDRPILVE